MHVRIRLPSATGRTVADLVRDLGDIPLDRVRLDPPPGLATIDDVEGAKGCELVDGTLVEKAVGWLESMLGVYIARMLAEFVSANNLGVVSGEEGGLQLLTGLVRKPDVAFISWDRFPNRRLPEDSWPAVAPDLAIEVINKGNTPGEMGRKRWEYFKAGTRVVWEVDRFSRTVTVYTSPKKSETLTESDTLSGGAVLPGFALKIADIFAQLERHG